MADELTRAAEVGTGEAKDAEPKHVENLTTSRAEEAAEEVSELKAEESGQAGVAMEGGPLQPPCRRPRTTGVPVRPGRGPQGAA